MNNSIKPGQVWLDTEGKRIQAHGAQVFYENGTYYWVGENKDHTTGDDKIWTWGIRLYSSKDLYNWKDEGLIVEPDTENENSHLHPFRQMDRPHILYNERTRKYVLWLKYCDGAHYAVLTSDSLKGTYETVCSLYRPFDVDCGDYDLQKDEKTGEAYLYFEVNHTDLWCAKLSEDYTEVTGEYSVIYKGKKPPFTREAPAHFVRNGKHYIITSGMTGYLPNPSEVTVSDNWMNGYEVQGNPHVDDKSNTSFHSQISCVFKVHGKDMYIAIADRWVPDQINVDYDGGYGISGELRKTVMGKVIAMGINPQTEPQKAMREAIKLLERQNTSIADYVWLPIEFEGEMAKLKWQNEWKV